MSSVDRQSIAPLLAALKAAADRSGAAFHTPGHKKGQGASLQLQDWLGRAVFQADLPELPELDNLFAPEGVIQQAQTLAAEAFGAEQTCFLANGSTGGIEAAVLAVCSPGDKLILPRNVHRSAISALILSGAMPIFVEPEYDVEWDLAHCVTPAAIEAALTQHSDAKAVLIVSPTYYGVCGDVASIAQITQAHNIPLLVDEAHGAHFHFHSELPLTALAAGADVAVQSTHKTLSAFTQAAMLHVQGNRIDRDRLNRCLQLVQSTSPNYLLLASLDAARHQMALQGKTLMQHTLDLADSARTQISQISGLAVLQPTQAGITPGCFALDRTRLTVDVSQLGITGFAADEFLHPDRGVTAELPGLRHLTFIISLGNTAADIDRLIQALKTLATTQLSNQLEFKIQNPKFKIFPQGTLHVGAASPQDSQTCQPLSLPPLSPRTAFFSPAIPVPIDAAIGQISAELVCPYPPGIPVLFPGEVITTEAIEYLQQVLLAGGVLTGCADPELQTLRIIKAIEGNQN